jgi:hypothetical protein
MTEQQIKHKEKRENLKALSKKAKQRINTDCEGMTVNEVLINEIYKDKNNFDFKTLKQWNELGYKVKKNSTSFLVWGKPRKLNKNENSQNNEDEEDDFFPLCYLFSNAQVIKNE